MHAGPCHVETAVQVGAPHHRAATPDLNGPSRWTPRTGSELTHTLDTTAVLAGPGDDMTHGTTLARTGGRVVANSVRREEQSGLGADQLLSVDDPESAPRCNMSAEVLEAVRAYRQRERQRDPAALDALALRALERGGHGPAFRPSAGPLRH